MSQKLENFILENKEKFDVQVPYAGIWKYIKKKLPPSKTVDSSKMKSSFKK